VETLASQAHVVLVRPRRAANVAAACRAMKNMGVERLTVVDPPPGLDDPGARALAYGAWDVLDAASTAPDLRTAVADATVVVATSARLRGETWSPREMAADPAMGRGARIALVFGPEDSGLRRGELALAHVCVRIPSHASQPSLNLAQAVLIVCYELFVASSSPCATHAPAAPGPVSAGELEACIDHLREAWLAIGFLNGQAPDGVLGELRGLFWRARPTQREVALLRGVARQTLWKAGQAPGGSGEDA
jgi:TrmH family RNA methyltransferase